MKVVLDTSFISAKVQLQSSRAGSTTVRDMRAYAGPIERVATDFADRVACIASVTLQELLAWGNMLDDEIVEQELRTQLAGVRVLEFTEAGARVAAHLQRRTQPPRKMKPRSLRPEAVDIWFRDAAVAGTAFAGEEDSVLVTADADFLPFKDYVGERVRVIFPDANVTP